MKTARPVISSCQKRNGKKSTNARYTWAANCKSRVPCRRLLLFTTPHCTVTARCRTAGTYILGDACSPSTSPRHPPRCWEQPRARFGGRCHHGPRRRVPAGLQLWCKPGANTLLLPHGKSPHHLPATGPEGNTSSFMHFQQPSAFKRAAR